MQRRIVKHGNSTLSVSLPSEWAKLHKIKKGDMIDVESIGDSLVINNQNEISLGEITITIPNKKEFMQRYVTEPYLKGYNKIKIVYEDKAVLEMIEKLAELFLDFEIIEVKDKYCVLKNVSKGIEDDFESLLYRLNYLVLDLLNDTIKAVNDEDYDVFRKISERERLCDKLSYYLNRQLNIVGHKTKFMTNSTYTIVKKMEEMGDQLKYISEEMYVKKLKLPKEVMKNFELMKEFIIVFINKKTLNHKSVFPLRVKRFEFQKNLHEYLIKFSKCNLIILRQFMFLEIIHHLAIEHYN